jgi:endonuclease YncB( thermonuclease family)
MNRTSFAGDALVILLLFLTSCGHLANPAPPKVELTADRDRAASCEEVTAEIMDLQAQQASVQKQIDAQRTQNILSGVGGYLIIVPFAFIDPTTSKNDSKYSYEQREEYLRKVAGEKGCTNLPLPLEGSVAAAGAKQKPTGAATWRSRVLSVLDGETIMVADGGNRSKIGLYGIDAPEPGQQFSEGAKSYLQKYVGRDVDLQFVTRDSIKDRDLCIVYYGFPVNTEMLKAGLAWYYERSPRLPSWQDLQTKARERKIGIWSDPDPIPPWQFRGK